MTASDESPSREVGSSIRSFLGPKTTVRLGAWNVRTMFETTKTAQVIREMNRYNLDILGVSECRWTGSGRKRTSEGPTILYSGRDNHSSGVALIISKSTTRSLMEWEPISDRLIRARFDSKFCKLTILQCYAPTNEAEEMDKDDWYEQLQQAVSKVPQHDMLLITGDLNAKVGSDNTEMEDAMGQHGCGTINDNGERLVDFCTTNRCVIGGSMFPHKDVHKDGHTVNQIDHIIVNKKWRRSLQDVKVQRGADVGSDHYLVLAKVRLKLRASPTKHQQRKVLDIRKLRSPEVKREFTIQLRNCFSALQDEEEQHLDSVEESWGKIKSVYNETAEKVIGYRKKKTKEWITPRTWHKIDERRKAKDKLLSARSPRLIERAQEEYKTKDKEVKKSARKDKRAFVEELASKAEQAAAKGELSKVYKITKQLCGQMNNSTMPVKDKQGKVLTTEQEQAARWVQHFKEVLNRPKPDAAADPPPSDDTIDIDINPPAEGEVLAAIKAMKCGKAPGIDTLQAELLKADVTTATKVLTDLFRKIWEQDIIPQDWSKGIIFKLPKKGDLSNCDNWRGITLLSIPSKVFCRLLLNRIDSAIDDKLRQEHAGFQKGRGCIDQIFALRNIVEQCLEWNTPLYINFIDFKKAFDSIHCESLWTILRAYGIPPKIVTLIGRFYEHFECSVILENTLTESFQVKSGVRQGCILSPILFLITIDWVMRQTTSDRLRGIQWALFSHLEDLDFADDLAVLSSKRTHIQEKTDRLSAYARQTGLHINKQKTQVMCINTSATLPITIDGEALECVEDFTYLGSLIKQ